MNPNRGLLDCEALLARLDAALELAATEVDCSSTASQRLGMMVSRLLDVHERRDAEIGVIRLSECSPNEPANDDLASVYEGAFKLPASFFGNRFALRGLGRGRDCR